MHDALRKFGLFLSAALALLLVLAPLAQAAPYAYVTSEDDDTLTVIDTANNSVVATIAVGSIPFGVTVSHDGTRVYAANSCMASYCGDGSVSVIDTAANQVIDTIAPTFFPTPTSVAVSPDGARLYVTNNTADGTVSMINSATNTVFATVDVGYGPRGVAVSPGGTRVYVANQCAKGGNCGHGTLSVINTPPNQVVATIALGLSPAGVAVSPDGTRVYVVNEFSGSVSVINATTDQVIATVLVGNFPIGVAVSPDGARAYVANWGGDTVSVIDAATNQVTDTVTVGTYPASVAFSPDGTRVYVVNYESDTVSVIDAATDKVVGSIPVGYRPFSLGSFVGPGALIANDSETSGSAGTQLSATLPALVNATTCSTTDATVEGPAHGRLDFSAGGGEFTYTPDSATYSGPDAFTWRGEAPANCTAAKSPIDPVSNTATVLITLNPAITGLGNIAVNENKSAEESFSLAGSSPFTLTLASNNQALLPTSGLMLNPADCGADDAQLMCTLAITPTSSMTGEATVTVTVVDAHGDRTQEHFTVTVMSSGGGGSGGGGGASTPLGLLMLAVALALAGLRRGGLRQER
ncbi:MAG: beta-propeller fold lactonase family protein [Gammaproteobacteria bacterium]